MNTDNLTKDIIDDVENFQRSVIDYGKSMFNTGKEEGDSEGYERGIEEELHERQQLEYTLKRLDELSIRGISVDQLIVELQSELCTHQPTLGLSNSRQTRLV